MLTLFPVSLSLKIMSEESVNDRLSTKMSYVKSPEEHQIVYETIPDRLRRLAETRKTHSAFVFVGEDSKQTLSYIDVYQKSVEFAKGLILLGIGKGDVVAIANCNSPEWVFATFGTQMTGASPLHFVFSSSNGTQEFQLLNSFGNCSTIILHPGHEDRQWKALENQVGSITKNGMVYSKKMPSLKLVIAMNSPKDHSGCLTVSDVINLASGSTKLPTLDPEFVAAIFLTSGSTGMSKGIALSHHSMITYSYFSDLVMRTHGKQDCIFYNDRPFSWAGGYPVWTLSNGGTIVTINSLLLLSTVEAIAKMAIKTIKSENCTCAILISTVVKQISEKEHCEIRLKTITCAGQPIPSSIPKAALQICDEFVNYYGCSEVGGLCYKVFSDRHPVTEDYNVGIPFPGIEVKIVDEEGIIVPRGTDGEVYIRSPIPFVGYLNNPKQVRTQFGWFKTDDFGRISENGELIVCGRRSDIIIVMGLKLSPAPIEDIIKRHPSVFNCYVFPVKDEVTFQKACAAIDVIPGAKVSRDEVYNFLVEKMNVDEYGCIGQRAIPKHYAFFNGFPKTSSGKINRKEIVEKSIAELGLL